MKNFSYILIIVLCMYTISASHHNSMYDQELIEKYKVDQSLKAILDENTEALKAALNTRHPQGCIKKASAFEFPWLPGYIVKTRLSRIRGVEKSRKIVEENNLDLIEFPEKYTYECGDQLFIIVPKTIPIDNPPPLSLKQVKQLWKFILESNYNDFHKENYLRLENDKILIIDTEQRSFGRMFRGLSRFIRNHYPHDFEEDAFKYVLENLAAYFDEHIPKDIEAIPDTVIQRYGRNSYAEVYKVMYENLTKYEKVFDWDYVTFFEEHFPNPTPKK